MGFKLGDRSRERLIGVHPDLVLVLGRAIQLTEIDFTVLEGVRTYERQQKLFASGDSQTLRSRHLTGDAVDIGALKDGKVVWDWDSYNKLSEAMKAAAAELNIPIEWGGDWVSFKDGPHYQRPWS